MTTHYDRPHGTDGLPPNHPEEMPFDPDSYTRTDPTYRQKGGWPSAFDTDRIPPPVKRKRNPAKVALAVVAACLVVACGFGVMLAAILPSGGPARTSGPIVSPIFDGKSVVPGAVTPTADASPAATTPAAPPKAVPPAAPSIEEGTWSVGEDFPAGTYQAKGAPGNCYYAVYKSSTDTSTLDGIVTNHIGGGNLKVVLKAGQGFETKRCGVWSKVG